MQFKRALLIAAAITIVTIIAALIRKARQSRCSLLLWFSSAGSLAFTPFCHSEGALCERRISKCTWLNRNAGTIFCWGLNNTACKPKAEKKIFGVLMNIEKKGFTLIEMAIVLVVIGLIVGTIVPLLMTQSKTARLKEAKEVLRTAKDEIIGYALNNNACLPANLDEIGHTEDPWGKQLFYRPASELVCNGTNGEVLCSPGNKYVNSSIQKDAAFFLVSSGSNHNLQIENASSGITFYDYGNQTDEYPDDFYRPSDEFDDLYEYETINGLKSKMTSAGLCSKDPNGNSESGGGSISFNENIAGFDHIIESSPGVIDVNENSKTITIGGSGGLASGCIWYGQDTGPCTDGVCDLGSGFRAFFRFKSTHQDTSDDSTDYASGFTFAVTSDTESPLATVCGGNGAHLGYAGTQPDYDYWIAEPKMGIEVDFYPSEGLDPDEWYSNGDGDWVDNEKFCFNKRDENNNHVAVLFWGNAYGYRTKFDFVETGLDLCNKECCHWNPPFQWESYDEDHNGDDNRHGAGSIGDYHSLNSNSDSAGYSGDSGATWLEDAQEHTLRIDLDYNSTSGNAGLRAWVDVEGSNNTEAVMTEDSTVEVTNVDISPLLFRMQMNKIRFGWTVGSSDEQAVELSDFKINFLDYNSTNST